ncbi:hypothetical protein T09_11356 [Trichinella sp. T9]|nr:hypothetical protein T09_11356 [Trichinella sp. T9]
MEKKEEKWSKRRASERMVDRRYDLPKSSVKGSSLQRHNE